MLSVRTRFCWRVVLVSEEVCWKFSVNYGLGYFGFLFSLVTSAVQEGLGNDIATLKKELAALKQIHDSGTVDSALALLGQHLARPAGIFEPHAALAALDNLVDITRDKADQRASRFSVVLRQTRPLLPNPAFQQLLLKLVGDKEEVLEAKEIQKVLNNTPEEPFPWSRRERPAPYSRRLPPVCFNCGARSHIASRCFAPASRGSTGHKR